MVMLDKYLYLKEKYTKKGLRAMKISQPLLFHGAPSRARAQDLEYFRLLTGGASRKPRSVSGLGRAIMFGSFLAGKHRRSFKKDEKFSIKLLWQSSLHPLSFFKKTLDKNPI